MFGHNNNNNIPAVAYTNVRLIDERSVDLYIHNSRGKGLWTNDAWLGEGRPRALSSLNLSTWSLLTTSIREYQAGLSQYTAKIYLRMILPIYFFWFASFFIVDLESVHGQSPAWIISYYLGMVVMVFLAASIACHFKQQHVDNFFNPGVSTVLEELTPKLTEAGYEVVFMVETGRWFQKPSKSFLRFTPLPDAEERRAVS